MTWDLVVKIILGGSVGVIIGAAFYFAWRSGKNEALLEQSKKENDSNAKARKIEESTDGLTRDQLLDKLHTPDS